MKQANTHKSSYDGSFSPMDKQTYKKYVRARAPASTSAKNCVWAFLVGGAICAFAEWLKAVYPLLLNTDEENTATLVSITLIFISVLLTSLGVFDKIAKHAGAGTLVPITGFANAVASPAIDSKGEGLVLGVGAKMFTVAGPVIVYGTVAGVIYGVIYWLSTL